MHINKTSSMKRLLLPIVACIFAVYNSSGQTASYSVIPLPQMVKMTQDAPFRLKKGPQFPIPKAMTY